MITTSWTKEQVQELINREELAYQEIDLPYGLSTGGRDRRQTSERVFADSIKGKSVLDIGCFLGYFCHEAVRCQAGRVVGIDVDEDRLRQARLVADCVGMAKDIEFKLLDIETNDLAEHFDVILMLNVLHHLRNPISVLDKVITHTKERLILEVASPASLRPKKLLKSMGTWWWTRRKLEKLPLVLIGRNGAVSNNEQKFFFTPLAMTNLLMEQRGPFARLEIDSSNFKNRYIAIAWKRQVGRLVIIGGVTSSGKTTFIDNLKNGELAEIASQIGVDIKDNWTYTDAANIKAIKDQRIENAIFHYDILRAFGGDARYYSQEQGVEVLDSAAVRKVITIWCDPKILCQRQQLKLRKDAQHWRQRRVRSVLGLYQNEKRLAQQYQKWIDYCRQKGAQLFFVDCTSRPRLMPHSEWDQKIKDLLS